MADPWTRARTSLVVLLGLITAAVHTGVAGALVDEPARRFLAPPDQPVLHRVLGEVVRAGDADVMVGTVAVAAVGCVLLRRPWGRVVRLVCASATAALLVRVLKLAFDRTGSYTLPGETVPGQGAYPSGHVVAVLVVSGMAWWAVTADATSTKAVVLAGSAAALESAALLLLRQHWLTDVIAGWLLGQLLLITATTIRFTRRPLESL